METAPLKREVECLKCGERRVVPNSVDMNDLPPDWNCSLRTWAMNPTKRGFDEFYGCNNGKINNSLIKAYAAVLTKKRAEATEVMFERQITAEEEVHIAHESDPSIVEALIIEPLAKKQKRFQGTTQLVVNDPTPEGIMRTRIRELVEVVKYVTYVPAWYAAHVARGKWQAREIARHMKALGDDCNAGIVAIFVIDMKSKTATGKNREEQGHGMGARGMSLQGGMLYFFKDGELQRVFVDLIYDQTSNQHLEEAMTGLAAQLHFIRKTYPHLKTIWMVSDKCSNFNSFNQIPFIVARNERNWATTDMQTSRRFKVEKWIFTEAQLGKDDLDCHFSWIRRYFQYFVNIPGQNLTKPEHMFKALTHNTLHLDNTHVLWGNTKHAPLKRKFVLSKLKVQSVHEYVYVTKKKGLQEVKVSYHGGITSTNMQQSFTTKDAMYTTWLADTGFNPTDWVEKGTHSCRPEKIKKGKRSCEGTKRRKWKTLSSHVSEYKKTLIMFVKEWALDDYNTHRCIEDIAFRKSEYETTKTLFTGTTKGWAMKKSPPPVHIPHDVRLELVKLFNQKAPYVQPEEALAQIQAMEEFRNDVFVDHILTPAKIKAYFGRLLVIKKKRCI